MEKLITKRNLSIIGTVTILLIISLFFIFQNNSKEDEKLFDIFLADLYNEQNSDLEEKLYYLSSLNNPNISFFSDLKLAKIENLDRYDKIDKDIILLKKALFDLDIDLIKSLSSDDNFTFNEIAKIYLYNLDITNYKINESKIDNLNNFFIKAINRLSNEKIKYLVYLVVLSSCNQYLGTVDPDYTPKNEITEIFTNYKNDLNELNVDIGNIIFPHPINSLLDINKLKIDKIINTDEDSIICLINDKIILSKDKSIYLIHKDSQNNFEINLNLNKDEKLLYIFDYKNNIHILTNKSRLLLLEDQKIIEISNFEIFTNTIPIVSDHNLIIFSVFEEIFEINLDKNSISKKDTVNSNPGISIKSNIFEDEANLYYLFNSGTLLTFNKEDYEYTERYILQDLNILTSLGLFKELVDTPFSYSDHLYFLDKSGKIATYNPVSSEIFWEVDLNNNILNYLFSNDGYLIVLTLDKIYILSDKGKIINSYVHKTESPLLIFNIQKNIFLISKEGIKYINFNKKSEDIFYENKFTTNIEIYSQDQNIYIKDNKSLFKLSE